MRIFKTQSGQTFIATGHEKVATGLAYTGFVLDQKHTSILMPADVRELDGEEVLDALEGTGFAVGTAVEEAPAGGETKSK